MQKIIQVMRQPGRDAERFHDVARAFAYDIGEHFARNIFEVLADLAQHRTRRFLMMPLAVDERLIQIECERAHHQAGAQRRAG